MVASPVTYDFTPHLRARDHFTRFWKCLGTAFGHLCGALKISWSRLLARVRSGPAGLMEHEILMIREIPAACNSDRELGKVRPKRVFVSGESGPFSGHLQASH